MKKLTFAEWVLKETGSTWQELIEMGADKDSAQRGRLYMDYMDYCNENGHSIVWDFKTEKERLL